MKQWISLMAAAVLLLSVFALPVSAADVDVKMDAPVLAKTGDTIDVAVYVTSTVGGVQGTVNYDAAQLSYAGVALSDAFAALGNTVDTTIRAEEGKVHFVALSAVDGSNAAAPTDVWFTLQFTVLAEAGTDVELTLTDVAASNTAGSSTVTVTATESDTVMIVSEETSRVTADGATIRTVSDVAKQGLRFQSTLDLPDAGTLTEIGIVMLPKALLYSGQDLTVDMTGKNGTKPAVAKITDAAVLGSLEEGENLYATLIGAVQASRVNVEIVARAYMVVDGVTYYSFNEKDAAGNAADGEVTRSVVSVAQSIARYLLTQIDGSTEVEAAAAAASPSFEQVQLLLTFLRENAALVQPS